MDKNKKNDYPDPDDISVTNVVPASECTGLVGFAQETDEEIEALSEICDKN